MNTLFFQDASNSGGTDAKLSGDIVSALALPIEFDDSGSERRSSFRFGAGLFGNQTGNTLLTNLAAKAGEVSRVDVKCLANIFDFADTSLDQLNGAKAMQGLIGQRTGMSTLDGDWTYQYDLTGQLVRAVFVSSRLAIADQYLNYEHDAVGNRVRTVRNGNTVDYATNALNQYTTSGDTRFRYDLDGNLIEEIGRDGTRVFTYDELNQLVEVTKPEGTWQYEYDVFGNRTAVVFDGERTEFLLDPTGLVNVIGEYNDEGLRTVSYVHGLGLESVASAAELNYYDFGAIGSTSRISGASGNYVNEYAYEPFGELIQSMEGIENSFEFVGEFGVRAEGNGLSFMRARYYSPKQGRFTGRSG